MEDTTVDQELLNKKASLAGLVMTHNLLKVGCFQAHAMFELDKSIKFISALYQTLKEEVVKHPDALKDPDIKAMIDAENAATVKASDAPTTEVVQ